MEYASVHPHSISRVENITLDLFALAAIYLVPAVSHLLSLSLLFRTNEDNVSACHCPHKQKQRLPYCNYSSTLFSAHICSPFIDKNLISYR